MGARTITRDSYENQREGEQGMTSPCCEVRPKSTDNYRPRQAFCMLRVAWHQVQVGDIGEGTRAMVREDSRLSKLEVEKSDIESCPRVAYPPDTFFPLTRCGINLDLNGAGKRWSVGRSLDTRRAVK